LPFPPANTPPARTPIPLRVGTGAGTPRTRTERGSRRPAPQPAENRRMDGRAVGGCSSGCRAGVCSGGGGGGSLAQALYQRLEMRLRGGSGELIANRGRGPGPDGAAASQRALRNENGFVVSNFYVRFILLLR